jgi:hypothetical protein
MGTSVIIILTSAGPCGNLVEMDPSFPIKYGLGNDLVVKLLIELGADVNASR